jgi:hypothetical protein
MGDSPAIYGLVSKRAELAGRIIELQRELDTLSADVSTLDGAIKIIDPSYDLRSIKAKRKLTKNQFFGEHGEASRFVLNALREAGEPLTTNQIADLAADRKHLGNADMKALRACILTTLSRQRVKGIVAEMGRDETGAIKWALAN